MVNSLASGKPIPMTVVGISSTTSDSPTNGSVSEKNPSSLSAGIPAKSFMMFRDLPSMAIETRPAIAVANWTRAK